MVSALPGIERVTGDHTPAIKSRRSRASMPGNVRLGAFRWRLFERWRSIKASRYWAALSSIGTRRLLKMNV